MGRLVPTNSSAAEAAVGGNGHLGSVGTATTLDLPSPRGAGVSGAALPRGQRIGRLWWDPARHTLDTLPKFLSCAAVVEKEVGLPASTPWFLSSDTFSALELPEVKELQERGKLVVLDDDGTGERTWHLAHVDRSHANLGLQGFVDSYVAYLLLASAKAVVLSRSFFGETAAEIGAVPHVYFAEGCVRADIHSS